MLKAGNLINKNWYEYRFHLVNFIQTDTFRSSIWVFFLNLFLLLLKLFLELKNCKSLSEIFTQKMLFFKLFSLFALVSVIVYQAHGGHEYSHQHFKLAKGHYHYKYKWNVHNHGYAKASLCNERWCIIKCVRLFSTNLCLIVIRIEIGT